MIHGPLVLGIINDILCGCKVLCYSILNLEGSVKMYLYNRLLWPVRQRYLYERLCDLYDKGTCM